MGPHKRTKCRECNKNLKNGKTHHNATYLWVKLMAKGSPDGLPYNKTDKFCNSCRHKIAPTGKSLKYPPRRLIGTTGEIVIQDQSNSTDFDEPSDIAIGRHKDNATPFDNPQHMILENQFPAMNSQRVYKKWCRHCDPSKPPHIIREIKGRNKIAVRPSQVAGRVEKFRLTFGRTFEENDWLCPRFQAKLYSNLRRFTSTTEPLLPIVDAVPNEYSNSTTIEPFDVTFGEPIDIGTASDNQQILENQTSDCCKLDKFKQFSTFKQSFTSNVSNLKRRFSSGELNSEHDGEDPGTDPSVSGTSPKPTPSVSSGSVKDPPGNLSIGQQGPPTTTSTSSGAPTTMFSSSKTTSAPTSPIKGSSFLTRVQSLTGVAREYTSNVASQVVSTASSYVGSGAGSGLLGGKMLPAREVGVLCLLVIDDMNTDWSKYFKTRKIHDCEIRVEQCEFSELSVTAMEGSCAVSFAVWKEGIRVVKQSRIDFILIRQNLKDAGRDYKNQLLSLMYGGVPSVNSLQAVYNFQDKPWVFAHMMNVQRKLGRDAFPLIDQCFYPDFKEMSSYIPKLPAVLKIGHAHGGLGKIRVGTINDYQDASSVVAVTGTYCTSEPYVEARCDVHVQKIGNQYKAFMRKGIVGHWKSGSGSAMLEQIQMNDKFRSWVDNVATLFGGLDICALEVIVGKDGREYIIEVNDSALSLMGESQEEDRRHIAELVLSRMNQMCKPYTGTTTTTGGLGVAPMAGVTQGQAPAGRYRRTSGSDVFEGENANVLGASPGGSRRESQASTTSSAIQQTSSTSSTSIPQQSTTSAQQPNSTFGTSQQQQAPQAPPQQQQQQQPQSKAGSFFSRQNSNASSTGVERSSGAAGSKEPGTGDESEDTMKNLRKTFAGIFGDM